MHAIILLHRVEATPISIIKYNFYFIADYELITNYTITLSNSLGNAACGTTAVFTAGPVRVNSYISERPEGFNHSNNAQV